MEAVVAHVIQTLIPFQLGFNGVVVSISLHGARSFQPLFSSVRFPPFTGRLPTLINLTEVGGETTTINNLGSNQGTMNHVGPISNMKQLRQLSDNS